MPIKKTPDSMSSLAINDLALQVYLGWGEEERRQKQVVSLTLHIQFPAAPKACQTDKLRDTVCYDSLIKKIQTGIAKKHFHLVEHLAATIYQIAKKALPEKTWLSLSLAKHPKIKNLHGGVCFGYWEDA